MPGSETGFTFPSQTGGIGESNSAANVGAGAGLVRDKTGVTINLRSLTGIGGISAAINGDVVEIDGSGIVQTGEINTGSSLGVGVQIFKQKTGVDLEFKSIRAQAGSGLAIADDGFTLDLSATFGQLAGQVTEGNDSRIPTQDENDALQGTSGAPTAANRYVTNADSRVPTQAENDALLGTVGAPSGTNRYVTNDDPTNSDPRTPIGAAGGQLGGTYPNPDVRGLRTTDGGGTLLTMASVTDGQVLVRQGTNIQGLTGGGILDEHVKISAADTTPGFLDPKVNAGPGILTSIVTPGGNEQLQFAADFGASAGKVTEGNDARLPTTDQKAALVGTAGAPSAGNPYVTDQDTRVPTQDENDALQGSDGIPSNTNRYVTQSEPVLPVAGEKAALAGTTGTPGALNRYVTETDTVLPSQDENDALQGTSGTPSNTNRYVTDQDARVPIQAENDALQGTSGTPSNTNRYVTNIDPRNTNARIPTGTAGGQLGGTYPNPDVRGIREQGGPTELTIGTIADGDGVVRSGTALNGVALVSVTDATPADSDAGAAAVGVSVDAARADHKHQVLTGTPVEIGTDSVNSPGVADTLARSDHDHAVNVPVQQASATALATTTSTTDVLMSGMSITPGAGDYLAMFSATPSNSNINQSVWASLYVNGVQVAHTERERGPTMAATETGNLAFQSEIVGVGVGEVVDVRWRVSGTTGSVTNRTFTLIRLR